MLSSVLQFYSSPCVHHDPLLPREQLISLDCGIGFTRLFCKRACREGAGTFLGKPARSPSLCWWLCWARARLLLGLEQPRFPAWPPALQPERPAPSQGPQRARYRLLPTDVVFLTCLLPKTKENNVTAWATRSMC